MAELVDFECSVHGFRVATFESAAVTCGLEGCQRSCSPPQWVRARQDSVRRRASAGTWTGRPGPGGHRTGRATAHQQQEPEAVVETDSGPEPVRPSQVPSNASPMMTRTTDTRKTVHHCQSPCRPLTGGITTGTLAAVGKRRLKAGDPDQPFFSEQEPSNQREPVHFAVSRKIRFPHAESGDPGPVPAFQRRVPCEWAESPGRYRTIHVQKAQGVKPMAETTTPCVNRQEPEAWNERDPRGTSQRVGGVARVLWGLSTVRDRSLTGTDQSGRFSGALATAAIFLRHPLRRPPRTRQGRGVQRHVAGGEAGKRASCPRLLSASLVIRDGASSPRGLPVDQPVSSGLNR
jgi:hypothetical protein